jgi:hypothetical protein
MRHPRARKAGRGTGVLSGQFSRFNRGAERDTDSAKTFGKCGMFRSPAMSLVSSLLALTIGCTQAETARSNAQEAAASETIGTATEEVDGTIVLNLRATSAGGAVGDGQFRYTKSHPQYATIKAQVGPIPRGGSVMVKPFPDK